MPRRHIGVPVPLTITSHGVRFELMVDDDGDFDVKGFELVDYDAYNEAWDADPNIQNPASWAYGNRDFEREVAEAHEAAFEAERESRLP
jgi:hypothetical protein